MRTRKKEKEVPVRNNPGIYKRYEFDEPSQKWKDTGKYRALRRISENGLSRKEQANFDNIDDAKAFRAGTLGKSSDGTNVHVNTQEDDRLTFGGLIEKWKPFHFLRLEYSTQQTYEKRLPHLDFLKRYPVEEINTSLIDELVSEWVKTYPKDGRRFTFEKELSLLKVILNFYKKRTDPSYVIPVLDEHYEAADIAKKAAPPVQSLSQKELWLLLEDLRASKKPMFFTMALTQFCLGLRIGEVCGMSWDAMDLENRIARIEQTITWDQITWEPRVKQRPKNGKVRILVIPELLAVELSRLRAVRDPRVPLIFHTHGRPMNRQTVAKAFNRALERLGISHVRGTHMLRKTSATIANEITGDFYAVSKLMDHSSPDVTLRYVAQTTTQKRKVADALNSALTRRWVEKTGGEANGFESEIERPTSPVPACPRQTASVSLRLVKSTS